MKVSALTLGLLLALLHTLVVATDGVKTGKNLRTVKGDRGIGNKENGDSPRSRKLSADDVPADNSPVDGMVDVLVDGELVGVPVDEVVKHSAGGAPSNSKGKGKGGKKGKMGKKGKKSPKGSKKPKGKKHTKETDKLTQFVKLSVR